MNKPKTTDGTLLSPPTCSPVFYDGKDRRGYCAYCLHGLEARDTLEFAPECQGCMWTDAKKNWRPMPDFDKENDQGEAQPPATNL